MRIIAGRYKGRRLAAAKGMRLRPTAERVREAIFAILGRDLYGLWVLDLFAGTGAMGLEALSREAAFVVLVDLHPTALRLASRNVAACGNPDNVSIRCYDLRRGLGGLVPSSWLFDLVFLDPPYGQGLSERCLAELGRGELLKPAATVVSEHGPREDLASAYGCLQRWQLRRYGNVMVSFYRRENG